jgi:hypothetical protein
MATILQKRECCETYAGQFHAPDCPTRVMEVEQDIERVTANIEGTEDDGTLRTFETGATRDTNTDKLEFEGFLSPLVLTEFARYMHRHRLQSDGTLRASDNWQKGMPFNVYMHSAWRHFMDWWRMHRGLKPVDIEGYPVDCSPLVEALCALMFNVMGYLHEVLALKERTWDDRQETAGPGDHRAPGGDDSAPDG